MANWNIRAYFCKQRSTSHATLTGTRFVSAH